MEHRSIEKIREMEAISAVNPTASWSASQRLRRWAEVVGTVRDDLQLLHRVEHMTADARQAASQHHSPFSVAYADPLLRAQGLNGESYGDAMRFFGISARRMHRITCSCGYQHRYRVSPYIIEAEITRAARRAELVERWAVRLGLGRSACAFMLQLAA